MLKKPVLIRCYLPNRFAVAGLLLVLAMMFSGCESCYYQAGARSTPEFVAARGARVYVHAPRDKALADRIDPLVRSEISRLGFSVVSDPGNCDLIAYYYYSYDLQEPSYIHDFMVVFKPYPGDKPAVMASASCYHPCSSNTTDYANPGREVHEAFSALRHKIKAATGGCGS